MRGHESERERRIDGGLDESARRHARYLLHLYGPELHHAEPGLAGILHDELVAPLPHRHQLRAAHPGALGQAPHRAGG